MTDEIPQLIDNRRLHKNGEICTNKINVLNYNIAKYKEF